VLGGQAQIGTALGDWCTQVARMQRGEQELVLKTGDLSLIRDFIEIDAVIDALVGLGSHPLASGLVNVGSGVGTAYRDVIEMLRKISGIEFSVQEDPDLGRSGQRVPEVIADCGRLRELLGESPGFNLARAVEDCLTESRGDHS
jgi:GDP-4-dehydro-6-deoxy-D-mannose reductase